MKRTAPWLAWTVVAAVSSAAAADPSPEGIHGCPDASGSLVYQDGPCDEPAPDKASKKIAPVQKQPGASKPAAASKPVAKSASRRVTKPAPPPPLAQPIRRVIDSSTFTSDPRWGSPERTLKTFIAAMKDGDRATARSCLTASAQTDFGPRVDSLPRESLRSTVAGYTSFVLEGEVGPFWSIRALRTNARPKWIFFERTKDGTWKISAI